MEQFIHHYNTTDN